jgi:DNA repair protein RecN (Recombination protein N)
MLKKLKVQNYALIQNLDIEFNAGFSTLTGETGAGKSILLGALSLVLGARADLTALKNNESKCIVEGVFKIDTYNLIPFFTLYDLDYEKETLIRREINTSGKSRAFINDTPVNLNIIKELAMQLIDIHSQHESLDLINNQFQLKVIDSVAQNSDLLKDYKKTYQLYKDYKKNLDDLKADAKTAAADYDYNLFQYNQLTALKINELNQKELEEQLETLNNAEEIQQSLSVCYSLLSGDETSTLAQLNIAKQALVKIKPFYTKAEELINRLNTITIDLKDIALETELSAEQIEFNPQRALQIKEQLDSIYDVMHKHQVDTLEDLMLLEQKYSETLEKYSSAEFEIAAIEKKLNETSLKLESLAKKLSEKRTKAAKPFTHQITQQLAELGMPYANFKVALENNANFLSDGKDKVSFLFSANKNQPEQNISKIASGGEISRLMLSIKSILSESMALPTIIFDEIDTGVSGEIADKMASIMKNMAHNMQVISITHLPQIAARGKNHYRVFKEENDTSVKTQIVLLSEKERIEETARLLSGKDVSTEAIANAKKLINS